MAGAGGALGAMRPGSVWVDLTTNSRELVLGLASTAPAGVAVVDSPVTGAVDGARLGTLTLFVGGEPEPVAVARALLENLGTVIECGPLGSGNVVKLVTNQLWFAAAAALGEGLAVGVANGVAPCSIERWKQHASQRGVNTPPRGGQACGGSKWRSLANRSTFT